RDSLRRLGIDQEPHQWTDLTDPRYYGQLAVCDPSKSGSMTQAFEMIIQQQMQRSVVEGQKSKVEGQGNGRPVAPSPSLDLGPLTPDLRSHLEEGWMRGLQIIQKISANARYFTDTSQKINIDVGMGDCAAGMTIDFYGRFQQENIVERSGDPRFGFHTPEGGSTVSADPIGLLRGAPNRQVAEAFIEFVLSLEGQKLWNFKLGAPGGPETFALRRPPIRPELYSPEWNHYRSDADYNPYVASKDFSYHAEWTGMLFSEIRTIIRVCFLDVRKELAEAWAAIIKARNEGRHADADRAEAIMADLSRISYEEALTTIDAALQAPRIEEVRLSRELSEHFRKQYQLARDTARGR
ncbi:MAG TPA: ABC transporter substrate-binding protein, partial [Oceanipulchritudo sp.]|nr:ABC transporter substrate-binding protein [Oceanipulchritudo sp.]